MAEHNALYDGSLEKWIVAELKRRKLLLVTAESCTGGLLAKHITDQAGASTVFETGLVTYANTSKMALLGVPETLLSTCGAVSREVVQSMAEGARLRYGGDVALAISGIAGPDGGTEEKPVGLVWLALATAEGTFTQVLRPQAGEAWPGRDAVRQRAVSAALKMLRRYLEGLSPTACAS